MPRSVSLDLAGPTGSRVVSLDNRHALLASVAGSKAAALSAARAAGLPVERGVVLTTDGTVRWHTDPTVRAELERAWLELSDGGRNAVIVRSSSTIEDTDRSSMAGVFRSVLDVRSVDGLLAAVEEVITHAATRTDEPLAVLVQPMVDAAFGGVLFGADPITGRTDRVVVAVVPGGPDVLVRGAEQGARYVLGRNGRVLQVDGAVEGIGRRERRALIDLARRTQMLFGAPQDIEWAFDRAGVIHLLQSRPISTLGTTPRGRAQYGSGPVAETFPVRLSTLEADLWVPPLDEGVTRALAVVGVGPGARATSRKRGHTPTVFSLDGWVVAHLDALAPPASGARRYLDPRVGVRRLRSAWSTGRLRSALPARAASALAGADAHLAGVPALGELDERDLVRILERSRPLLRSLHGHEVLCGIALRQGAATAATATGASAALTALQGGRARGLTDAEIVALTPVVLALVPPRIGGAVTLPPMTLAPVGSRGAQHGARGSPRSTDAVDDPGGSLASTREQLRLRVRWVHELTARTASELGRRLTAAGRLPEPLAIRDVPLEELRRAIAEARAPELRPLGLAVGSVPARFVLDDHGRPVAVMPRRRRRSTTEGQGAGGGRATGVVVDRADVRPGAVLVVQTLDPDLAPVMPGLAAIVAETGSVLSHLAILAREYGVATVVGVPDAVRRWPPGVRVEVDGVAGTVLTVEDHDVIELSDRPEVGA